MRSKHRKHPARKGIPAIFLVAGLVIGLLLISPAGAHISGSFSHLFNQHIKPKFANPGVINDTDNPVDWTRLKNVPGGIADGVDDTGGPPGPASDVQCNGCVTSADVGTITVRTASTAVDGGGAENSAYVIASLSRFCVAGEEAISWSGFFDGDLNPGGPGGSDDHEVTIASVEYQVNVNGLQGYVVHVGNDSGVNHTFTLQVKCLAV